MGHTCNSVIINAPYDLVFDISNDINRWKELFDEYKESEILTRVGNKITFKLTNQEGQSWQSWRLLFKENYFCYAERENPKFPFDYMKLIWLYREVPEGIEMTWIQHFTMDTKAKFNDQQVEGFINKHSVDNLKRMKEIIEAQVKKS
ncbi:MAG: SRPBCC family protein [Candidatus Omnitrophota bacterium]